MQNNQNELPDFLTQNQSTITNPAEAESEKVFTYIPLRRALLAVIALWAIIFFVYLQFFFGWQNVSALLPVEFAGFASFSVLLLLFSLLFVALIFKEVASANQAAAVQTCLNRVLFNDKKNVLSAIFDKELQKQIGDLSSVANNLAEQTRTLKQEMGTKVDDFTSIGALLENNFMENLQKLNSGIDEFTRQCQNVTTVSSQITADLAARTEDLKNSAREASDTLNPLINETLASSEHFQNILRDNKDCIAQANSDLSGFCETSRKNLLEAVNLINAQEGKIEQTFLKTADNCSDIFQRLDAGIAYIEDSLKTHKALALEQASLIEKNSSYLDGKLGEYGRLIILEVEAMIKRSSTLENNVKKQLSALAEARSKTEQIIDGLNANLEQKSTKAVKNIENIIATLGNESQKLSDFVKNTESKNSAVEAAAEKITQKIGNISMDLGLQIDSLKTRSIEAIDKINEVSGTVQKNALQLSEAANVISAKGKENRDILNEQNSEITQAVEDLENVKQYFADISKALKQAGANAAQLFAGYKSNVVDFNSLISRQLEDLSESRRVTENHLQEIRRQYDEMDIANFIDSSASIVQNLNNISVDINRFFNGEDDEALWKKFYSGDYAAFARNVVKNMSRKQILKIREEYERNSDFRLLADKYLGEFEVLLNGVRNSEKPQIIMALLSGSELGKVYYVLARALDKLG